MYGVGVVAAADRKTVTYTSATNPLPGLEGLGLFGWLPEQAYTNARPEPRLIEGEASLQ